MDTSCVWDVLDTETTILNETKTITNEYQPHGSLYQLVTCVRVIPRTGSGRVGRVVLCLSSDVIVVAVENQLMLFSVTDWQMFSTLGFESTVDCVKCNGSGSLLVVGERSGAVHVIDVKTGEQLISQRLGCSASDRDGPFFKAVEFSQGASSELAVLTSDGCVHVVDGLLTGQLKHSVIDAADAVLCLAIMSSGDIITTDGGDTLSLWSIDKGSFTLACSCSMFSGPAVKCAALPCDDYALILHATGHLILWNVHCLVAVSLLSVSAVTDFTVVDRPMDSPQCIGTIATLHNTETSGHINVYSMPCAELIYSVEVHQGALLFPSSTLIDCVYVLEVRSDAVGWQVRRLAETDPQTQLRRLLARQQFGEAESFAEKFDLDVQFVYREFISHVLTTLSRSADAADVGELTSQLMKCLSQLDDVAYVVDCCVTTLLPSLTLTNQLLSVAQQRLDGSSRNLSAELQAALNARLEHTTRRLAAFQAVFGAEEYSEVRWRQFQTVDLYDELCQWLRMARLDVASSLCGRFADVLSVKLVDRLDATLAMLPDDVALTDLCAWLSQDVMPPVLASEDTSLIDRLASWVEKRATDMEVRRGWPENAIRLCEVMWTDVCGSLQNNLTMKQYACRIVMLSVPQTRAEEARDSQNALVRLRALRNDFQQMMELRDKYNCCLSLAEFRSENVQSLAYRLLDRVGAAELIFTAISDVICPYAKQNCLNLDELLACYVQELVHRRRACGMRVSAVWESKAVEILRRISSRELGERSLMAILGAAQFPWSEDVSEAVKAALLKNPSHAGLVTQCRWASLREILIRYDLQTFNFAETTHAEDLAYYMLTMDQDTAVEDALVVTDMYSNVSPVDVYLFRCGFLTEHDRPEEIVHLLRGIASQTLRDDVCERFVCYCGKVVSDPLSNRREKFAVAARHLHQLLNTLSPRCSQALRHQLSDLDAVHSLDSKFGKFITVSDFSTTSKREELCDEWLDSFFEDAVKSTSVNSVSQNTMVMKSTTKAECVEKRLTNGDVCQVARLMKMSARETLVEAVHAARRGDVCTAVKLADRIVSRKTRHSAETVRDVLGVFVIVCENIKAGCDVSLTQLTTLHDVSCRLVLTTPSSLLDQCLRVCRLIRLAVEVARQCSSDDHPLSPGCRGTNPYTEWSFDEYLSDDDCSGLVMDIKSALSPVSAAVASAASPMPASGITDAVYQSIVDVVGKMTRMLIANDQTRLYLGYALEMTVLGRLSDVDQLNAAVLSTLKQSVSRRRADHHLALSAVLSLPSSVAHDNLRKLAKSAGCQYKKALAIVHVGQAVAQLHHNAAGLSAARSLLTETRWGYRLAKAHVSFRGCFGGTAEDKRSLIATLATAESVSLNDVVEYCTDFKLDVSNCLCLYLTCLLVPSPESTDLIHSLPFSEVQQRVQQACRHADPQALIGTLEEILAKTSPYDYERLEFILDQLMSLAPSTADQLRRSLEPSSIERDKKLLVCLKSYHRVSLPTEDELLSGDEVVRTRLPFHPLTSKDHLDQMWRIITAELNADTVHTWIPMAVLLHLPVDGIYMTAVRNIVRSHVSEISSESQWSDVSVDSHFMDTVHDLLTRVRSMELSLATVSWMTRELPAGAERVKAHSWCVSMQEKQLASCSPEQRAEATKTLDKYRCHYRQAAIEQVLHTSGLAEPALLSLTSGPARLIFCLYEHPSITQRVRHFNYVAPSTSSTVVAGVPDINAVVDRIASIGSVNTSKVRRTLLDRWLESSAGIQQLESADVTMVGGDSMSSPVDSEEGDVVEVDLLRAVYLLQHPAMSSGDMVQHPGMDTLLTLITCLGDCDVGSSVSQQLRVTRCLFLLTDQQTAHRLSPNRDWIDYLTSLLYTSELRRLRVFSSGSRGSFEAVDKSGLVRALCRCRDDTSGRVAASLAEDFGLFDPQIWNAIIRRLTMSNLSVLVRRLPLLAGQLTTTVSSLVMSWLVKDLVDLSSAVVVCLLVHRCPSYVEERLLRRCVEEFHRHSLPLCAVACALMLPCGSTRSELIQLVMDSCRYTGSADGELAELERVGRVLPTARQIMDWLSHHN